MCAESDWWNAISGRFSESFSLKKTALFSFFTKNIVKFLCLRKEVLRIAYIYKKEDCDCRYCLYYSKGKCKLQWCCCYQDKVRTCIKSTKRLRHLLSQVPEPYLCKSFNRNFALRSKFLLVHFGQNDRQNAGFVFCLDILGLYIADIEAT